MSKENFKNIDFYRYRLAGSPLSAAASLTAIAALAPENALLLVFTPVQCVFASWNGNQIVHLDSANPVSDIFEFYCFTAKWQLHWIENGSSGLGQAVLTAETPITSLPDGTEETKLENCLLLDGQKYLLWGKKIPDSATLYDRRVGALPLPRTSAPDGTNAYLSYNEIFTADEYGNVSFVMQRLTGIA